MASLRVTLLDGNIVAFGPQTVPASNDVVINTGALEGNYRLQIEYLDVDGNVIGYFEQNIQLEIATVTEINNPAWINATGILTGINLAPFPGIVVGEMVQANVTLSFSAGPDRALEDTDPVTFNSAPAGIVGLSQTGEVTGLAEGQTSVSVSLFSRQDAETINVAPDGPGDITQLQVIPAMSTIGQSAPAPTEVQLQVLADFSGGDTGVDVTDMVDYESLDMTIATVQTMGDANPGLVQATGMDAGPVTIRVSDPANPALFVDATVTVVGDLTLDDAGNTFTLDTTDGTLTLPDMTTMTIPGWNNDLGVVEANNFTLTMNTTLDVVGNRPFRMSLFADGTVDGTINANGGNGGNASQFIGGTGGAAGPGGGAGGSGASTHPQTGSDGVAVGPDGNGKGGSTSAGTLVGGGGGGGAHLNNGDNGGFLSNAMFAGLGGMLYDSINMGLLVGGSGGGGGSTRLTLITTMNLAGGGGGGGGGVVSILANGDLTVTANGVINANGGNGGLGALSAAQRAGGGGGGAGGSIELLDADGATNNGTLNVNGGNGGAGSGGPPAGGAGSAGRTVIDIL